VQQEDRSEDRGENDGWLRAGSAIRGIHSVQENLFVETLLATSLSLSFGMLPAET
jgi:hypothetical protein